MLQRPLFDASPCPLPAAGMTVAEYFAGIGLARIGFEQAGWTVTFANDIDRDKKKMHDGHFGPSAHYVLDDIHALAQQPEEVPETLLAHASFPCTDLSLAGARRGLNSGQSSAFWGWIDLLSRMQARRPPLLLIENVTGLLTSRQGTDFRSLVESLNELGYLVDALVLDAAHFTPQSRPRLFIVGIQNEVTANEHDLLKVDSLQPTVIRPNRLIETIQQNNDLEWKIADLTMPPEYGALVLESVVARNLPPDSEQWWSNERAEYLLNQMSDRHREIADQMIGAKRTTYGTVFRRVRNGKSMAELRTDGLAGCLRTPKGGSGRQILFQAGGGQYRVRLLNAQECARLMGAADYQVTVSLNQALYGFGDAVCVDAVTWVAEHRLNPLARQILKHRSLASH